MGWLRGSRQEGSYDLAADVPAERLAHLLRRARVRAGLDDRGLAKQLGVRPKAVLAWESGEVRPDDEVVQRYAAACGVGVDELLRRRDVVEVDPERGTMRVGTSVVRFDWQRTTNAMVLHTYVGLVREQRGLRPGQPLRFRDDDVESLAHALDLTDRELEARFVEIIGLTPQEAADVRNRMIGRRLAVPAAAAGVLMASLVSPSGATPSAGAAPAAAVAAAPAAPGPSVAVWAISSPPGLVPEPLVVAPAAASPDVLPAVWWPPAPDVADPPPAPPPVPVPATAPRQAAAPLPAAAAPSLPPPTIGVAVQVANPAVSSAPPRTPLAPPPAPPAPAPPAALAPPTSVVNPAVTSAPPGAGA